MSRLRLGTLVLPSEPWPTARAAYQQAEQLGFDIAYSADHLTHATMVGQWWADGWATLGAAAASTSRIELGTLVGSTAFRPPAVLARTAASLADLSGGRFVLGLGAGAAADAVAAGQPAPSAAELADRFASTVEVVRALWEGSDLPAARALAVAVSPLPAGVPAPHLMLAAHGRRGFDVVARFADGWSTYGGPASGDLGGGAFWDLLSGQLSQVTAACEAVGRDPATLRRSVLLGWGADRPLASAQAFADAVGEAVQRGFDEVVVYWPHGVPGDRFWAEPEVLAAGVEMLGRSR